MTAFKVDRLFAVIITFNYLNDDSMYVKVALVGR